MNLLFDLIATQPYASHKFHGGGKYTKQIYLNLINQNNSKVNILALFDSKRELDAELISASKQMKISLIDINESDLPSICEQNQIDRFYSGLIIQMLMLNKLKCEVIGTIHGLRDLELPLDFHSILYADGFKKKIKTFIRVVLKSYFFKKRYKEFENIFFTSKIYTVSFHSKYSIMSFFPKIDESRITVYYAPDVTEQDENIPVNVDFNSDKYFLLVSGNRWLKNNLRTAIALDELFTERSNIRNKVIIAGVPNPDMFLKHLKNKDRFVFYNYVDDDLLFKLYKEAFAFFYMSLNEGFGYPPLDAMKYGVPVVSSPFTSLTEIFSDAVLYADPYSIKEIKNRALQLFNEEIYQKVRVKGYSRYVFITQKQISDIQLIIEDLLLFNYN